MNKWLKNLWEGWKKVARATGRFQTKIILTAFYVVVVGPAWLALRITGADPLKRRARKASGYWTDCEPAHDDFESSRRQF